jgi:glycosyltransferase involved in cell wall biosynthesis
LNYVNGTENNRARAVAALPATGNARPVLISVVIPHLNQPYHLRRCLAALHEQQGFAGRAEVIVVDNGSDELPVDVCAAWPDVTLLSEGQPGPGPARNTGIEHAGGDILAFIDADCRADPRWLSAIATAFSDPDTQVIGGDVQVPFSDPGLPTSLEAYERIYAYRNRQYIASGYSGTGNLSMRPQAYASVGPFAGIELAEDRDWGLRARQLGIATQYVPDMIVFHPARQKFSQMKQKWDRHILHDFSAVDGVGARLRWIARALAIAASPAGELHRIMFSDRLRGARQRLLALTCLVRVRLYRAGKMLRVLARGDRSPEHTWNRK